LHSGTNAEVGSNRRGKIRRERDTKRPGKTAPLGQREISKAYTAITASVHLIVQGGGRKKGGKKFETMQIRRGCWLKGPPRGSTRDVNRPGTTARRAEEKGQAEKKGLRRSLLQTKRPNPESLRVSAITSSDNHQNKKGGDWECKTTPDKHNKEKKLMSRQPRIGKETLST